MSDNTIELNRRRVLGGLITIGGAAAAAGAGTFAYFSDTQTSNNNEITAGTLTLNGAADGAISATNIAPGQSVPSSGTTTITATYDSGSSIDPAEVDFNTSLSEPSEPSEPSNSTNQSVSAMASQLNVDTANLLKNGSVVSDLTSSQGVSTVNDLDGLSIDSAFGGVSPNDTVSLELAVTMDSGAGNDYQADGVLIAVTFTAEQPGADA